MLDFICYRLGRAVRNGKEAKNSKWKIYVTSRICPHLTLIKRPRLRWLSRLDVLFNKNFQIIIAFDLNEHTDDRGQGRGEGGVREGAFGFLKHISLYATYILATKC